MSNVKAGDIAKLIHDPTFPGNVGRQLYVREISIPPAGYQYTFRDGGIYNGLMWLCETLQPMTAFDGTREFGVVHLEAGREFLTADAWLKRIDPPGDWEEVFSDVPLEFALVVLSERLGG